MNIKIMYIPKGNNDIIKGFVVTKGFDYILISIVDNSISRVPVEIKDVEIVNLDDDKFRFKTCLLTSKHSISNIEWDAMRKEAIQNYGINSSIIPTSKQLKNYA